MDLVFRKSRWAYGHWYLLVFVLILGGSIVWRVDEFMIAGLLFALALLTLFICEIARIYERVTFTDKEIHYERGIIARDQIKVQYRAISNVSMNQGVWQRIMGYGDLFIDTPGGSGYEVTLRSFAKAPKIEKHIQQKLLSEHAHKH